MIAIIDYGVGNLRSVEKAFSFIGCEAVISSDPVFVGKADAVVLPGVGAYAGAMEHLKKAGMEQVIRDTIGANKPFLGICLGLQLLFEYSEEGNGRYEGLGIFKGAIKQLPMDMNLKIPHMGWNCLELKKDSMLFAGLASRPYVYFVHSYYLDAVDRGIVAATARYGIEFDAAISSGNVFATQFHPEKSGETGLKILKNFISTI